MTHPHPDSAAEFCVHAYECACTNITSSRLFSSSVLCADQKILVIILTNRSAKKKSPKLNIYGFDLSVLLVAAKSGRSKNSINETHLVAGSLTTS